MRKSGIVFVLFSSLLCASAAADFWPEFRGPRGQGNSSATNVPISWDSVSNVAWCREIPGRGWSSPVVKEGRIYLTAAIAAADDGPASLCALCLNFSDGQLLWKVQIFEADATGVRARHKKNSLASATPLLHDDRLYIHFGHMGIAALDLSGKVLWRQTGIKYPPLHGNGGSPILAGDALIFSCDGTEDPFLVALNAKDGQIRWKTPRNTPAKRQFSFSTPLLIQEDNQPQIISPGSGFVAAYNPADGHEIWRVRYGEGYSLVPRPVFGNGLLYITTGFDQANLLAIDPSGAHGDVTDSHVKWTYRKSVPTTPSLLSLGNEIYFVSDGGIATCLDAQTGKLCWSERLESGFSASPVSAEGRIYFQNETGTGFVLKAGREFKLLSKNAIQERTLASYAVLQNALLIRSESHLWKIGK